MTDQKLVQNQSPKSDERLVRGNPYRYVCALLSFHPESMVPIDEPEEHDDYGECYQHHKCRYCGKVVLLKVPAWRATDD